MHKLLIIGVGGFIGAVLRYLLSGYVQKWSDTVDFPYGTLVVNLVGCLLIGMFTRMDELRSVLTPEVRLFLFIGILGAFTTFSTFGNETINLLNDKRFLLGIVNIGGHILFCLLAVMVGRLSTYLIWR